MGPLLAVMMAAPMAAWRETERAGKRARKTAAALVGWTVDRMVVPKVARRAA